MESTHNVVIYTPIEKALFLDGGLSIFLAVLIAGIVAGLVMGAIDKHVRRFTFVHNNTVWFGGAAFVASLYLIHLANVKGWL